mgnify:FL=1
MFNDTYKEAFVLCRLISVDEHDDGNDRIVLDIPVTVQNQIVLSGGRVYPDRIPLELDGAECIAHIVYRAEADAAVAPYKIAGDVKKHPRYAVHWPRTVGDMKTAQLRAQLPEGYSGELPVYKGADKDEPAPFCAFAEDDYVDR